MTGSSATITLVAAVGENGVIGKEGGLPWRLPDDLRHFRRVTLGKPVILGRKTFETLPGPLEGRINIVLTRREDFAAEGCLVARTIDEALALAGDAEEIIVAGGSDVYRAFLPRARRFHLTRVHARAAGDTYFPEIDESEWVEVSREEHPRDDRHAHAFTFLLLEKDPL